MARKARVKSNTGIYHVLIRAIANLSLFTDDEDYQIYTGILNDLQHEGRCEIYAYALFPTHVHLLIKDSSLPTRVEPKGVTSLPIEGEVESTRCSFEYVSVSKGQRGSVGDAVGVVIKRLAASFSYYYNVKYDHYGPIYQDRFKSNPVETKDYFLKVLDHIGSQQTEQKFTCHHISSGLPSSPRGDQEGVSLLDFKPRPLRVTDSKLLAFLRDNYSFTNIGEFLQRPEEDIKATIKAAKNVGGSIRQITRLTGSPYQYVFHVK